MSILHDGEEDLHNHDGGHNWGCPPPGWAAEVWQTRLMAHMDEHRANPGAGSMPHQPVPPR